MLFFEHFYNEVYLSYYAMMLVRVVISLSIVLENHTNLVIHFTS